MKLLFDENLSPKLVRLLSDLFPASAHVRDVGLASASDPIVWRYAIEHDLIITSKDEDFHHLSFLRGAPPKVIGIHTGNCSTKLVVALLRERHKQIEAFGKDDTASFLALP
jgi:predicted nuclease of predicted toxin-antitoxin system